MSTFVVSFLEINQTLSEQKISGRHTLIFIFILGKCPRGTRYQTTNDGLSGRCISCPEHHYQDEEGQTTCKKCPEGKGSVKRRNIDINACKSKDLKM